MKLHIKSLFAAGLLSLAAMVPASADYTILQDSSMPSVLYVEFTDIAPKVIIAPSSKEIVDNSVAL
ncbi:MAG: hypothetical protein U5K75_10910, partial [Ahrensia sp.]|nr:hypothetical protein [Ahrensia sp.]